MKYMVKYWVYNNKNATYNEEGFCSLTAAEHFAFTLNEDYDYIICDFDTEEEINPYYI